MSRAEWRVLFYAGTGKLWRLVWHLIFTYSVSPHSDFKTSRHYLADLFQNILSAKKSDNTGTSGVATGFGT